MVSETNKFCKQVWERKERRQPHSRLTFCKDIDDKELTRFLSLNFLNARLKILQIQEYWSKNALLESPAFKKTKTQDQFVAILSMLHFSDNNFPTDNDTSQNCGSRNSSIQRIVHPI